jgi:hypothetical protein
MSCLHLLSTPGVYSIILHVCCIGIGGKNLAMHVGSLQDAQVGGAAVGSL